MNQRVPSIGMTRHLNPNPHPNSLPKPNAKPTLQATPHGGQIWSQRRTTERRCAVAWWNERMEADEPGSTSNSSCRRAESQLGVRASAAGTSCGRGRVRVSWCGCVRVGGCRCVRLGGCGLVRVSWCGCIRVGSWVGGCGCVRVSGCGCVRVGSWRGPFRVFRISGRGCVRVNSWRLRPDSLV